MKVTLPEFERAGVLVVGDVMLDRYWYGPTSRISPEAPVPVVKVENIEERPGGAANVAMNIASLGATSRLVGLTGIDDAARALSKALVRRQREVRLCVRPDPSDDYQTTRAVAQPAADSSRF